jgi:hypothetical protein
MQSPLRRANLLGRAVLGALRDMAKWITARSPSPHAGLASAGGDDFGPALRRNGSDAELGKMDEIGQNE